MRRIPFALLIMALCLTACTVFGGAPDITGTYSLVSIDGNPLPYTPSHEGGAPEILSSTLALASDGTFRMTMTYTTTPGNSMSQDLSGTYVLEEGMLQFDWEGAGVTPATLEGETITIVNEGLSFLYEK